MIALCKKFCEENYFTHESISVGERLAIYNHLRLRFVVVKITKMGFLDVICELTSSYFEEHFYLICNNAGLLS